MCCACIREVCCDAVGWGGIEIKRSKARQRQKNVLFLESLESCSRTTQNSQGSAPSLLCFAPSLLQQTSHCAPVRSLKKMRRKKIFVSQLFFPDERKAFKKSLPPPPALSPPHGGVSSDFFPVFTFYTLCLAFFLIFFLGFKK